MPQPSLETPLVELGLDSKTYHWIQRRGIKTVGELLAHSEGEILAFELIGPVSYGRICEALEAHGFETPRKKEDD